MAKRQKDQNFTQIFLQWNLASFGNCTIVNVIFRIIRKLIDVNWIRLLSMCIERKKKKKWTESSVSVEFLRMKIVIAI